MQDSIVEIKADVKNPEKRAAALAQLEQRSPGEIKTALTVEHLELTAADVKPFPKVQYAWDEHQTFHFQEALNRKEMDLFRSSLKNVNNFETLEKLIRQLVVRIGDSRFEGKYEDMLEACLIKLMNLSDPKEGLKLAPELLKKCLAIINRYFTEINIINFLLTPSENREHPPLYRRMLRCLGGRPAVFTNFDKIWSLMKPLDYTQLPDSLVILQLHIRSTLFVFDAQELCEAYLRTNSRVASYLLKEYGDEIDVNAVSNGSRLLSRLASTCVAASSSEALSRRDIEAQVAAVDVLLACPNLVITAEDIEAARGMNLGLELHPTLHGRLNNAFRANNFRTLRELLSRKISQEEAALINKTVKDLGDDIRQLESEEKMQLCACEFLTDETKTFLIQQNLPFGYCLMVQAIDTGNMPETFARLEALFKLGAYPWEKMADGVTTLADYAKAEGLTDLADWLLAKEEKVAAQMNTEQPVFLKTLVEVPVAAAASFASPVHPSATNASTGGNSNNDDVVTRSRTLSK